MKMRPTEVSRASSFKTVKRPVVKKRDDNAKRSPRRQNKSKLSLDLLLSLTPYENGVDMVVEVSRDLLMNCIQLEPSVRRLFFPEVTINNRLHEEDLRGLPVDRLAVAMVAKAISQCDDEFKFSCTIERNNLEDALREIYESVHWKKLGFSLYTKLYPDVVRNKKLNICLQDFIDDDGPEWAEKIIDSLMEPSWTMQWLQKIVRGQATEEDFNKEMNILFVKLHLLDPQSVIPAYHFLNNQRALPECNLELATRNYLGGPLDCSIFIDNVKTAILKESVPVNVSKISLNDIDIFYGVEVEEFILTEVRDIGVWNGRRPDNKKSSKLQDRCSIM